MKEILLDHLYFITPHRLRFDYYLKHFDNLYRAGQLLCFHIRHRPITRLNIPISIQIKIVLFFSFGYCLESTCTSQAEFIFVYFRFTVSCLR